MALAAVLLLAGAGARLGHRPKCLLRRGGTPLLHHLLRALQAAGVGPVVAVLGHHAAAIGAALDGWPVTRVLNPDPQAAPADSLRLGLAALPPGHGGVLVALGDHPWIDAADLRALAQAYAQRPPGTDCVLPSHGGQPGHPRVFSPRACAEICALPAGAGGPQWLAQHPARVHHWPAPTPHFVWDVDTPADLDRLAGLSGERLDWPTPP